MSTEPEAPRAPRNHVFIVDGTLSRLDLDDCMTHAARLHTLLESGRTKVRQTIGYNRGIQGDGMRKWLNAATGSGFNATVMDGYATLASRYRPGDRIFLFGFSRGAYAVRSIAGMIDQVGLLRSRHAMERRALRAFRYYQQDGPTEASRAFGRNFCHDGVDIACIGAWDTVKALGLPYPLLTRFFPMATEFHNHALGKDVRSAFHALAADEDRTAYCPVVWQKDEDWPGRLEQMWFPGAHGDIGGERGCRIDPIPLTNLSFVWMLRKAQAAGLILPEGWEDDYPTDPAAPTVGSRSGINRLFLMRRPRVAHLGRNGEAAHASLTERMATVPRYVPMAHGLAEASPSAEAVAT